VAERVPDALTGSPDDPWMTVAEFAEAMRMRPVTVRSWITKGQLKATRAGQRKWLVRRSELTRMLEVGDAPSVPPPPVTALEDGWQSDATPPPESDDLAYEAWVERRRERLATDVSVAAYEWEIALEQSRMAPPDARFASRIGHIAEAASARAITIKDCIDEPGFEWRPIPGAAGMTLSYELRPGGNRPGPKDAWERFDRVVARLGAAMEGSSASAVAGALDDLASAMRDLADGIENPPLGASGPEVGGGAADASGVSGSV
jgi:excisionase family DNA binding protein